MPRPRSPPPAPRWPAWAAHSVAYRIEAVRRFANVVRKSEAEFAELISRETGKPFWEARTEVGAVINKVEISINAYAERTPQRKLEAAMGKRSRSATSRMACSRCSGRTISPRTCPTATSSRR